MEKKPTRPARFALLFIGGLLVLSAGVFFTFKHFFESARAERAAASYTNLMEIRDALSAFQKSYNGAWPQTPGVLFEHHLLTEQSVRHPAWPDRANYMLVLGVRLEDDAARTLTAVENVPDGKRKLGLSALFLDGKIERLTETEYAEKVREQEERWKKSGRIWRVEALVSDGP